ncbi:MAG: hypothetical protein KJP05_09565, partial [Deltaproteobacteria bacterium]|nr:hypothetical protein [Deltaproteobacteria bacterium]
GMPKIGKRTMTPEGEGKVVRQNVMEQRVVVALDDGREIEFGASDLSRQQTDAKESHQLNSKPKTDMTKQANGDSVKKN